MHIYKIEVGLYTLRKVHNVVEILQIECELGTESVKFTLS
jgi:hypothetical protein